MRGKVRGFFDSKPRPSVRFVPQPGPPVASKSTESRAALAAGDGKMPEAVDRIGGTAPAGHAPSETLPVPNRNALGGMLKILGFEQDPVTRLQEVLRNNIRLTRQADAAMRRVVTEKAWLRRQASDGAPFQSFAALLVADRPFGLGVRDADTLRFFLVWLKDARRYDLYAETLRVVRRKPGNAKAQTIAVSDGFERFYTPSRSSSSLDQILPRLERDHPVVFADVCANKITPHEAAVAVGLIKPPRRKLRFGVCDFDAIDQLSIKARAKFLCDVFDRLDVDTQCALISRRLEVVLGSGLAQQWRTHST